MPGALARSTLNPAFYIVFRIPEIVFHSDYADDPLSGEATFSVDSYAASAADLPLLQPQQETNHNRLKALLVEDDPAQLFVLQQHIESIGLQTVTAQSIAEARERIRGESIAIGILDIHLPDGSGLDFCSEIDESSDLMGTPLVLLSSASHSSVVREARAAGGRYFLGKPYDPNVLITVVESLLREAL